MSVTLGGFSLIEGSVESGTQVSQMCDQCEIDDSGGSCWDCIDCDDY